MNIRTNNDRAAYFATFPNLSRSPDAAVHWVAIRGDSTWMFSGERPIYRTVDDFGTACFYEAGHMGTAS